MTPIYQCFEQFNFHIQPELFMEFPLRKKSARFLTEGTVKFIHNSKFTNKQRVLIKI